MPLGLTILFGSCALGLSLALAALRCAPAICRWADEFSAITLQSGEG